MQCLSVGFGYFELCVGLTASACGCRLELPNIQLQPGVPFWKAPQQPDPHQQHSPSQQHRQLLQTTSSTLNPTLECEGCPATDTRVRVTDTTQYPYTAVGMVTRTQSSSISR